MTAYLLDLADSLRRWQLARRTTKALDRLDDRMLDDAGVARQDIPAIAARQARERIERDRARRAGRTLLRAAARERAYRQSPRFQLALEHSSAHERIRTASRIPTVIDDIALGAVFRGRPCHAC
jgi:uncharacterized protein YjiS (DUF1127 family)